MKKEMKSSKNREIKKNNENSYIENNLIDPDDNMCLTVDSLLEINNIMTGSKLISEKLM